MTNVSGLLGFDIQGYGWLSWVTRLEDLVPYAHDWDIAVRGAHPPHPEFAPGTCARRSAIMSAPGKVCGVDAVSTLNFCNGMLCAVHCQFARPQARVPADFYALVERLRRKVTNAIGNPSMTAMAGHERAVSFRWKEPTLHVEMLMRGSTGDNLVLAANDPDVCPWCLST